MLRGGFAAAVSLHLATLHTHFHMLVASKPFSPVYKCNFVRLFAPVRTDRQRTFSKRKVDRFAVAVIVVVVLCCVEAKDGRGGGD